MKRLNILAYAVGIVLTLSSCDNFLSELPDDRTQINTVQKTKDLLVFAYPSYLNYSFLEAMSDNASDSGNLRSNRDNDAYYLWKEGEGIRQDTPTAYWNGCYTAIAQANQALESVEQFPASNEVKGIKAEAHLSRAYAHFMLVNIWGKAYNPATAASDLGVPYVLAPETELIKMYKRNTVQEVYDLIEKDLVAGLEDIKYANYEGLARKFHFNVDAAKAFAVRFYLHKGEWNKVIEYSDYLGVRPTVALRDYTKFNSMLPDPASVYYSSTEPKTNLLVGTVPSNYNLSFYYDRFSSSTNMILNDIFGANKNPLGKAFVYKTIKYFDDIRFIGKQGEYFKVTNPSAGTGYRFMQYTLFSNDEVYLARMEALVMENRISEALDALTHFTGQRTVGFNASSDVITMSRLRSMYPNASTILSPSYTLSNDQATAVQAIAEARRRELIHEGLRWFDIKRYDMEIVHFVDFDRHVLTRGDLRKQMQIPQGALDFGVTPNPR